MTVTPHSWWWILLRISTRYLQHVAALLSCVVSAWRRVVAVVGWSRLFGFDVGRNGVWAFEVDRVQRQFYTTDWSAVIIPRMMTRMRSMSW